MTEADEFSEKTAMNAEEPVLMPSSEIEECELIDEEHFFDETYADQNPLFSPKNKEEAIKRLKLAEQQFNNGQWHSLDDVMDMVRRNIS